MVAQYAVVLTLHHLADVFRQSLFQGLVVAALGDIFAALALVQNGLIVLAGDGRLEIYPAAMQIASHAGAVLGVATQTDDNGLQLLSGLGAFAGRIKVLKELVEHHIEEEEEEMFKDAQELLSAEQLEELGEQMKQKKLKLMKRAA